LDVLDEKGRRAQVVDGAVEEAEALLGVLGSILQNSISDEHFEYIFNL
jgi:hypothetical protein